jgi:hypothetical protein
LAGRGSHARWALALALVALGVLSLLAITASAQNNRQTDLVSIGPTGGNGAFNADFGCSSPDGSRVIFATSETLTSDDTDGGYQDIFERSGGTTTLISAGGNAAKNAHFGGCSDDALHVFFETDEAFAGSDTDSFQDVYERTGGTTTQVSIGPAGGNGSQDAFFITNTTDGSKAYFESYEQITTNDNDAGYRDVYSRTGSTTSLVSIGSIGGSGNFGAQLDNITPDGSHAYFHTDEALVTADTDGGAQDIYDRSSGFTTLVSASMITGQPAKDAFFEYAATDGSHAFFTTAEAMTSGDTDAARDAYDRTIGTTTLVTLGPNGGNGPYSVIFGGASTDGSKVWFNTREALVSGDTDSGCQENGQPALCLDVYQYTAGGTTWVSSGGNASGDARFATASQDSSRVFFHSYERLDPGDTDGGYQDIYERSGGTTTLISTGGGGPHSADLVKISSDGARVFFHTYESLVPADTDATWNDVYEHYGGENTLLSTGPASANEDAVAFLAGGTADGTKIFFLTAEKLTSGDTDANGDVYSATTLPSPGFARPKGATPVLFALVPAYQACTSGNRDHGPPLVGDSCNPPTQTSGVLTVGTGDANGFSPQSSGLARYDVAAGNVKVKIALTDVRCRATNAACPSGFGSAYTGSLLATTRIQATDRYNGSPPVEAATTQGIDIKVPVGCVFVSSTIGGACNLTTTVNALYPGAVAAGKRNLWEFSDFKVSDAGANGSGYGAGCPPTCGDGDETVFMRSGVWVP